MGGLAKVLFLFSYMFSLFLASCIKTFAASRLHSAHLIRGLFQLLVPGGVPCFPPPRFSFFPFSRVVGGNALRAKRQCKTNTETTKQNRPKWWKLADSKFNSLNFLTQQCFHHTKASSIFLHKTLRFSTRAKYTNYMADGIPQGTTTTQDTTATDQPVIQQEPPKSEEPQETPPVETPGENPKETEPTLAEESKTEIPPEVLETPQTPEPHKEETKTEDKPTETKTEEPKPEEKPKEETKQEEKVSSSPEPETLKPPETSQINLDELRAKANKERQNRKQEHLSEVEKLAKSKEINNDDVRELLHVSQSTATNYLEELTKQRKLKKSGKAKGTTYSS